jgi:hypothetical protein
MKAIYVKLGLLAGGATVGLAAVGTLTLGTTVALFSDSELGATNRFTAGSVTVAAGSASSVVCTVADMMPGDSSTGYNQGSDDKAPCTFNVEYSGSAPAWLGVDVSVQGGSPSLFDGTSTGLQFKIKSGAVNVINGVNFKNSAGAEAAVIPGTPVERVLVSGSPASQGDEVTFDIDYLLPLLADNSLQGGSSSLVLTFRAVQSANQPLGSCVAGRQCPSIVWG